MKTFIKWAGGKEKELPFILSKLPKKFDRYIEPFVGGGAVYFAINSKKSYINDKSCELMDLYKFIKEGNKEFLDKLNKIYHNWTLLGTIVNNNSNILLNLYKDYCYDVENNVDNLEQIKSKYNNKIDEFVINHNKEFNGILTNNFNHNIDNFMHELKKKLYAKICRMHKIETQKAKMSDIDILQNIECALKSAYYVHFRYLYNEKDTLNISREFASAIFYFIREYCYSAMFRYNSQGKFNVPYGGISYNKKDFLKKINYVSSRELTSYMKNTKIYNYDFEEFLNLISPTENDFIFLDPPYDTEFSTYAKNNFDKKEHERLAKYLSHTKAKFMLIIKNTDFIYNLYNNKGFDIKSFDKKYLVSFMNRNEKNAEHLMITKL